MMPEVIVNTSPIQYLFQSGQLSLLQCLYSHIIVPAAVQNELEQGRLLGCLLPDPNTIPWMVIKQATYPLPPPVLGSLGDGEREVLALSLQIPDALAVLDDGKARQYARRRGIAFTGTLGILLKAKQVGHVRLLGPVLEKLDELGFRCAPETRIAVLKLAGEQRD